MTNAAHTLPCYDSVSKIIGTDQNVVYGLTFWKMLFGPSVLQYSLVELLVTTCHHSASILSHLEVRISEGYGSDSQTRPTQGVHERSYQVVISQTPYSSTSCFVGREMAGGRKTECVPCCLVTLSTQCYTTPHSSCRTCPIILTRPFYLLTIFPSSRLLRLPKVGENIETSIKLIKQEPDTSTSSMPTMLGLGVDEPATSQEMRSSTTCSLSDRLDTTEAETETPRSLTAESSVKSDEGPSGNKILSLPKSWTEQSKKVHWQTQASPGSHTDQRCRLSPGHLTT